MASDDGRLEIKEVDIISNEATSIMEAIRVHFLRRDGTTGSMRLRFDKDHKVGDLYRSDPQAFKRYTALLVQAVFAFMVTPMYPQRTDVDLHIETEFPAHLFKDDDGKTKH